MKQKAFFIIFKRLSLKQIKQLFLEGEGLTLRRNRFQNHPNKYTLPKAEIDVKKQVKAPIPFEAVLPL